MNSATALPATAMEPIWLEKDLVMAIHARQLAEHGGQDGVRDLALLESALAKPKQFYAYSEPAPTLTQLAAAIAFGLARNHAFIDGNKRTAYVACRLFLRLNDYDLKASQEDKYKTFLALASGELSQDRLTEWLDRNLTEL